MAKPKKAPRPRNMNPLVTLRATTIPDKKKQQAKNACRKKGKK